MPLTFYKLTIIYAGLRMSLRGVEEIMKEHLSLPFAVWSLFFCHYVRRSDETLISTSPHNTHTPALRATEDSHSPS
ncbi:hypothetical protein Forpe1208_v004039 [Fusarium oxysporum f. sp. rapae]|uniref:Uncharacterized protein n=1 Tax=Fusarium oxysporum f. sp. rapae TaxID=485398 RepID=A0A8J5P2A9_FUSOX|nr:hypothetical protein Forpe1208_v004039 [Fusarium oxysporum f. sp. rapae]